MDNTRRPFNRSLSKEPGLKKPRLNEDAAAPDRISNGRAGIFQRTAVSNSDLGAASRAQRDRDSEGSDPARGTYQLQPGQQELVTRYKTALSELTFNSKPIITNLTIIAGESMQAAKAIAATICVNILEVPRDQKLPSLYLLDSIVKNIGRDYIKYFASRLPEVFCKAYRQVDPSIHPGMRHLFGTWKGVFPPQALQMIEKELGFTTTLNGSSSETTSKPDSPAQRPAHSIHVNPKYLEARRLQTTRAMGAGNGNSESLVYSHEDVESVDMAPRNSSGKSWADPYAKLHHLRDKIHEQVCDKNSRMVYSDSEHGSTLLGRSGLVTGRVAEKAKEPGYSKPRYTSSSDISGIMQKRNGFGLKHGFESHAVDDPVISDSASQLKKKTAIANSNGMSGDWKDTEEDDFVWKEMNTVSIVREMADASTIHHHSTPDNYERLGFDSHLQRSQSLHDNVSRGDDEPLAGPNSMYLGPSQSIPRTQLPLWSHRSPPPPEGRIHSEMVKTLSSYSEDYSSGKSSQRTSWPMHSLSELGSSHVNLNFSTNMTPGSSTTQTRQAVGAMPSLMRPGLHQNPSSPLSAHGSKNNFPERNRVSTGLPMDSGYKNIGPSGHFSEDSLHLPQNIQSLPPVVQKRKHASARSLEVPGFESSGQAHSLLLPSQISGSESRSSMVKSSSDQSNPLKVDSPRKSITSNLFDAVGRSRMTKSSISGSSNEPSSEEARPGSTLKPLSAGVDEIPSTINSTSNPVSNLLSTLVSKGLIRSSKSGSSLPEPPRIPDLPMDKVSIITRSTPKTLVPRTDEPSSSEPAATAAGVAVNTLEGSPKMKNLIGLEFRPDVVRNLHPNVICDITDVPFDCSICGLRLKLQERLERHMEWHATRDNDNNNSRRWYPNLVDWVAGIYPPDASECADDVPEADVGPLVPADESQCACVLCGELFDDFYSRERDEWMFRGAIYLTDPSSSGDSPNPVVHVHCVTEDSLRDLGLAEDVESKLEARR